MKYCVVKNLEGNLTTGIIAQGENTESLIKQALKSEYNGQLLTEGDVVILTEEECLARLENEPKEPQTPTDKERIEALESALLEIVLGGV